MKKKKETSYLDLYYKWMETKRLPRGNGLCAEFGTYYQKLDGKWTFPEGHNPIFALLYNINKAKANMYWGGPRGEFTPLRQNILLFMAAMNNEL